MKSIVCILLALFAMVGMGAATWGYQPPNVPPVVVPKYDAPYNSVVPGGLWLQDEAFLAGSGMEYQVLNMQDDQSMVVVNGKVDNQTQEKFATGAFAESGAAAVYFTNGGVLYTADGKVREHVKLDLHNFPAISRALKTLF
jgi:hypothetical protein